MKGIMFTVVVFLIMMGIIVYINNITSSNIERNTATTEKISAQRIYYVWKAVSDNFQFILNVRITKINNTIEINDTLPNPNKNSVINEFGKFVDRYFEDETIDICFQNANGANCADLSKMESKIIIKPMNIEYSWPDWEKKELFIKVDPSNFSFIQGIDMYIETSPDLDLDKFKWTSHQQCRDGTNYCLNLNLTVTNKTYIWQDLNDKIDVGKSSTAATASGWLKISFGDIDSGGEWGTVINVRFTSNVRLNTSTKITLSTSDFYINYPAQLNVNTTFGRKLDWLGIK